MREVLAAAQIDIAPDAKRLLLGRLGADRALSRAEIEKLALFAHGKSADRGSDVEAAVGDAAELALDRIVLAAASGRLAAARRRNAIAASPPARARSPSSPPCSATSCACTACAARSIGGRSMEDVVRSLRPPLHFKQREALEQQCRSWTLPQLDRALAAHRRRRQGRAAQLRRWKRTLAEALLLELASITKNQAAQDKV